MTRIRVLVTVAVGLIGCVASVAFGAQTPEQKCHQQRYNAAAKYAACQQKAMGKFLGGGGIAKFEAANRKCTAKYAATWPKLQAIGVDPCSGSRFEDNGDGTVTDNLTGLVWEQKTNLDSMPSVGDPHDADNTYSWSLVSEDALGTAFTKFLLLGLNGSGFAGQGDWRLPTLAELESIRALSASKPYACTGSPCIDETVFGPTVNDYWSSTTTADLPIFAEVVFFSAGDVGNFTKPQSSSVRAVRGGL